TDLDTRSDVDQFLRAVGSISANLAEGYSRRTGIERARYYDYARATAREAKDWYFKGRTALGAAVVEQRHAVLERIIRILTAIIPREREDGSRRRRPGGGRRREDVEMATARRYWQQLAASGSSAQPSATSPAAASSKK